VTEEARSSLSWVRDPSPLRAIHFWRGGAWERWTYERLAGLVLRAAGGLAGSGCAVLMLPSGPELVASLYGALLAGTVPALLAPPAPLQVGPAHRERALGVLRAAGPGLLVTAADLLPAARELAEAAGAGTRTLSFEELLGSGRTLAGRPASRGLLQFTSGSSGRPRGVLVPPESLAGSIRAIRAWLRIDRGDAAASWLPPHHDLGLIGCLMTPIASQIDLWLLRPEDFIRSPVHYLRALGGLGASLSAMPGFGLEHIARRVRPEDLEGLDLSGWRALVVGAERLRAESLDRFCRLLAPAGFRSGAILPAYGLAEATLAVTGVPLGEQWRAVGLDPRALALGAPAVPDPAGTAVVGCGRPLSGVQVAIHGPGGPLPDGHVGEIVVRGDSLGAAWAPGEPSASLTRFEAGALHTGDAGLVLDGQLFVLGRLGDSVKVRGLHLFAEELESALLGAGVPSRHVAVLLGAWQGVPTAVVVFDRRVDAWSREAESLLRRRLEGGRVVVAHVPAGAIDRTPSGKPRRRRLWQQFCEGGLAARPAAPGR
jgi:acyl-CoA synthetase (AMP-forming)/AMP-acid ligase II